MAAVVLGAENTYIHTSIHTHIHTYIRGVPGMGEMPKLVTLTRVLGNKTVVLPTLVEKGMTVQTPAVLILWTKIAGAQATHPFFKSK